VEDIRIWTEGYFSPFALAAFLDGIIFGELPVFKL
jgi:hypothetical protein